MRRARPWHRLQRKRRRTRWRVDNTNVLHEHAALEACAHGLGKSLFGGEALGIGAGLRERAARCLGALHIGEDTVDELVAPAVERFLDALDVAEVRPMPMIT